MTSDDLPPLEHLLSASNAAGGSARHRSAILAGGKAAPDDRAVALDVSSVTAVLARSNVARWRQGADGEELTGRLLAPLARLGWVVLHDRRIPGSPANVDHLVLGVNAVFVIDTKSWRGQVKRLGDGRLWYACAPLDSTLAKLQWEAAEVAIRLAARLDVAAVVHPLLCLHGVTLPADPLRFDGVVLVTGPSLLGFLATRSQAPDPQQAARLATMAADALPPAR